MRCPTCHTELPEGVTTCEACATVDSEPTVVYLPSTELEDTSEFVVNPNLSGYALVVERGPRAGMTFLLKRVVTTIGRDPNSDIFLNDATVSRHHCRFTHLNDTLVLADSGSTNGTYVNGTRIDEESLDVGDRVFVGKFHMVVAKSDV